MSSLDVLDAHACAGCMAAAELHSRKVFLGDLI